MRRWLWLPVLLLMVGLGWAAPATTWDVEVPIGEATSSSHTINAAVKDSYTLMSFTGFDDPAARLTYIWQDSYDGGVTWRDWYTATVTGGWPKWDSRTNTWVSQHRSTATNRVLGQPYLVRLYTNLTSPNPIQIHIVMEPR